MSKKTKKILAVVIPLIIVLLIVLAIVLLIVLNKDVCKGGHTFDKYALSEEDGRCQKICSVCGAKGEIIDHDYKYELVDSSAHKQICKNCGAVGQTVNHSIVYTLSDLQAHKAICNVCGFEEISAHTYDYECVVGSGKHKVTCSVCGLYSEEQEHVYDDNNDGTCNYCNYLKNATSLISITSDKTVLNPGDIFNVEIIISSSYTEYTWETINFAIGPLNEKGNRLAKEISPSFDLVDYSTSLDGYVRSNQVHSNCKQYFKGNS